MNYFSIYEKLYRLGYHVGGLDGGKNHGRRFIPRLLQDKWSSIIEIGCSNGAVVKALQDAGKKAYGIDASATAIELCRKNGAINCSRVSAHDLSEFKTNRFDSVFSCDVLEHLIPADADLAIKEICRIARKFIYIYVDGELERNREWLKMAKFRHPKEFHKIKNLHLTVWPVEKWRQKFIDAGCEFIEEWEGMQVFRA